MRNLIVLIVLGLMGLAAYFGASWIRPPASAPAPIVHRSTAPTIEKVRKLATLVTLDVPISDVHISEMSGVTGGIKLVMAVKGDVQIASDLGQARFEDLDEENRTAVLVLPRPIPSRPRLDHEKTRILELQRNGLWRFLLGEAGESTLANRAMATAQSYLIEVATRQDLRTQACAQTEQVLGEFFSALGWAVVVQWDDGRARAPVPTDPAKLSAADTAD
ncbi:MAG: DUF4230 domain-containing protein [Phycisphaerae bacterium]|nr:DUF4230 domain-containing protein [Phycisphaerae bacterium]